MYNRLMNQNTRDNNGLQYIFGYLDKNSVWHFPPHRFQLINKSSDTIVGQYLTSNWYSQIYKTNTVQRYMVLGIQGGISYSKIVKFIKDDQERNNTVFPNTINPIGYSVVFKDYFEISAAKTSELIVDGQLEESKVVNCSGIINNTILSLRVRKYNGGLYVTLPSFVRQTNL